MAHFYDVKGAMVSRDDCQGSVTSLQKFCFYTYLLYKILSRKRKTTKIKAYIFSIKKNSIYFSLFHTWLILHLCSGPDYWLHPASIHSII